MKSYFPTGADFKIDGPLDVRDIRTIVDLFYDLYMISWDRERHYIMNSPTMIGSLSSELTPELVVNMGMELRL